MALSLSYNTISEQYASRKPVAGGGDSSYTGGGGTGTLNGTVTINVPQLQPVNLPMSDVAFAGGAKITTRTKEEGLVELGLTNASGSILNNSNLPTYLINSSRVIINSKEDYTMLFGQKGVVISSPNKVNIDSDSSITLFGMGNVFLGVPNKGESKPEDNPRKPQKKDSKGNILKASPTKDFDYEPMVLGLKLANWLDDLIQVMKNAVLLTPVGRGYFREDTQYDLICMQARIKEMLSTYAFLDGYSHELCETDTVPEPPTSITEPPTEITGTVTGTVQIEGDANNGEESIGDALENLDGYMTATDVTINFK
jgi:hypothetical protein